MIDNDILTSNLEEMIRSEPLVNVDLLIGVTADEALYFAEEHIFNYLPEKHRSKPGSKLFSQSSSSSSKKSPPSMSFDGNQFDESKFFKKSEFIKTYLQTNYPTYLCFYDEIRARYMPDIDQQTNLTVIARQYTNLIR